MRDTQKQFKKSELERTSKMRRISTLASIVILTALASAVPAHRAIAAPSGSTSPKAAAKNTGTEIRVTLFGQPCLLGGPFSDSILKAIHSISPEQTPPPDSAEKTKKELDRIKKIPPLPSHLDRYRERLTRRLEALDAFNEALASSRKSGKTDALLALNETYTLPRSVREFETTIKGLAAKEKPSHWNSATIDQAKNAFENAIDAQPDEEFHRAIQRMNVKYTCAFEEAESE